ncbi:MAG: transcriptional initiation protein Tat, partial [Planctomycetes bacterium]|nr:transcriptional initiation protein Tat [Planctomycetota bacterium]
MIVSFLAIVVGLPFSANIPDAQSPASQQENPVLADLPCGPRNTHYSSNREPLRAIPLTKLPAGSIHPAGWLRKQLRLQADGFLGHLEEISKFLRKPGNAWLSPTGEGHSGWEEVPYWLKGYVGMAIALDDEKMLAEARFWIDGILSSQREDGYF